MTRSHFFSISKILFLVIACQITYAEEPTQAAIMADIMTNYEKLLIKAELEYSEAKQHKYAWRDTEKAINNAKELATQADFKQAIKALNQAIQECELARKQAATQTNTSELLPYYLVK